MMIAVFRALSMVYLHAVLRMGVQRARSRMALRAESEPVALVRKGDRKEPQSARRERTKRLPKGETEDELGERTF